jgi:hypothetical protein
MLHPFSMILIDTNHKHVECDCINFLYFFCVICLVLHELLSYLENHSWRKTNAGTYYYECKLELPKFVTNLEKLVLTAFFEPFGDLVSACQVSLRLKATIMKIFQGSLLESVGSKKIKCANTHEINWHQEVDIEIDSQANNDQIGKYVSILGKKVKVWPPFQVSIHFELCWKPITLIKI